jgi:hypothetical protein
VATKKEKAIEKARADLAAVLDTEKGWVYGIASSELRFSADGPVYRLGDSVDDWTPEQRDKHKARIKPGEDLQAKLDAARDKLREALK